MAAFIFLLCITLLLEYASVSSSEPLLLPLTHSLSASQFNSTHHLLKATSARSAARFHYHRLHAQARNHRQISLPLSPGSDYILSFSVGSKPARSVSLYMDTGSDLVWFPCSPFECILCEGKSEPAAAAAVPAKVSPSASPVSCKSPACSAAHSSLSSSDLCAVAGCPLESIETSDCRSFNCPPFYYAYGDGSLIARLYRDTLSMGTSSPSLILENFTFGCAHTALGEPVGVAGFGRGVLSLPAQLASFSPQLGNRFSYCLVSHSFDATRARRPSPLILGRSSLSDEKEKLGYAGGEFVYTPMLNNPKHPYFYSVGLEGVTVGKKYIPAPENLKRVDRDGNGGVVVDSGTTFTMLPSKFFEAVATELDRRVRPVYRRAADVEERTGLGPCYYVDESGVGVARVPAVALHFAGNSSVTLPRRNYFYEFVSGGDGAERKRKAGCLMLMNAGDEAESSGPGATLGNYQQQGFEVAYDLQKREVGFARRKCATLWDSLTRG